MKSLNRRRLLSIGGLGLAGVATTLAGQAQANNQNSPSPCRQRVKTAGLLAK